MKVDDGMVAGISENKKGNRKREDSSAHSKIREEMVSTLFVDGPRTGRFV